MISMIVSLNEICVLHFWPHPDQIYQAFGLNEVLFNPKRLPLTHFRPDSLKNLEKGNLKKMRKNLKRKENQGKRKEKHLLPILIALLVTLIYRFWVTVLFLMFSRRFYGWFQNNISQTKFQKFKSIWHSLFKYKWIWAS